MDPRPAALAVCAGGRNAPRGPRSAASSVAAGGLGSRPVAPNWENRGRDVQQYELRVKRLDVEFGEKVKELFEAARAKGRWKGTPAVQGPAEYWAEGVLAYFDASGMGATPNDAPHPITSREGLKGYDPGLYSLVNETMAYDGHVDWRYVP